MGVKTTQLGKTKGLLREVVPHQQLVVYCRDLLPGTVEN